MHRRRHHHHLSVKPTAVSVLAIVLVSQSSGGTGKSGERDQRSVSWTGRHNADENRLFWSHRSAQEKGGGYRNLDRDYRQKTSNGQKVHQKVIGQKQNHRAFRRNKNDGSTTSPGGRQAVDATYRSVSQ